MWAELKLKRTPYSTQFLQARSSDNEEHSDLEDNRPCQPDDQYDDLEDKYLSDDSEAADGGHCVALGPLGEKDDEEVSLAVEKKAIHEKGSYYTNAVNGKLPDTKETKKINAQVNGTSLTGTIQKAPRSGLPPHKTEKSHLPSLMDSEGYSSMESSCATLCKTHATNCACAAKDKWAAVADVETTPSMPVVIKTIKKQNQPELKSSLKKRDYVQPSLADDAVADDEEFIVHHYTEEARADWNPLDNTEPQLPPPPPLNVGLRVTSSDVQYQSDYLADEEPKVNKPKRCVSMRVEADDEKRGKRTSRRNSLLESRRKLLDILGTMDDKANNRGPQVKTIRKTIRRILRGTEVTDEEEEIVEEITEEVFGLPNDNSAKGLSVRHGNNGEVKKTATITRTVHQTEDGRKFLTTTMVNGQADSNHDGFEEKEHNPPTIVRVTTKRIH